MNYFFYAVFPCSVYLWFITEFCCGRLPQMAAIGKIVQLLLISSISRPGLNGFRGLPSTNDNARNRYSEMVMARIVRSQAAQAHFMNADVTLACEWCCVTNGYLQRFV